MENKAYRFGMLLFLFLLTGVLVAVSLYIGSVRISWKEIGSVLSGNCQDIVYRDIVMEIRFPRAVAAALLGGSLALSGYLLQTFFTIPLQALLLWGFLREQSWQWLWCSFCL